MIPDEVLTVDERFLLEKLPADGSAKGNISLMAELGWTAEKYWAIRNGLYERGFLLLGKGKGGSVRKPPQEPLPGDLAPSVPSSIPKESALYEPIAKVIKSTWVQSEGLDPDFTLTQVTAYQGRGPAIGVWIRPDITTISVMTHSILPGRHLEAITFEVKMPYSLNVTALYEALNHRRSATQSYVIYYLPEAQEQAMEAEIDEICSEARKHGIGVITVADPIEKFENWDVKVEPIRHTPDLSRLDHFLKTQLSSENKEKLIKWLK